MNYDGGPSFPDPDGATMQLNSNLFNDTDNDNGSNWGESTTPYGDGDLGTPGSVNTLSTKENQIDSFELYPNPTFGDFLTVSSDNRAPMKVSVYDILGKQVIQRTITNNRLNVSNLNTGVYILRAEQDNAFTTRKLIIN